MTEPKSNKMIVVAMIPGSRWVTHWIMDGGGIAQAILASCYKDPQKVLINEDQERD